MPSRPEQALRFLPDCFVLFKRLVGDRRVKRRARAALVLMLGYLAMPFDVIPDFLPVIGQLDDVLLVLAVLRYVVRLSGEDVVRELWPGTERGLETLLRATGRAAPARAPARTLP